jgi:hypothetical protein
MKLKKDILNYLFNNLSYQNVISIKEHNIEQL